MGWEIVYMNKMVFGGLAVSAFALSMLAYPAYQDQMSARAKSKCDPGKSADKLSFKEASKVYDCIKKTLRSGYLKGPKRWIPKSRVQNYRKWTPVSTLPANPGVHGGRFLFTYVNSVGAKEYLKYADKGVKMPAGTLIAKESFSVTKKGEVKPGPLFFMEKTNAGKSPASNDWFYYLVAPNGRPLAVKVMKACHECHSGFSERDNLGYPLEEARIK